MTKIHARELNPPRHVAYPRLIWSRPKSRISGGVELPRTIWAGNPPSMPMSDQRRCSVTKPRSKANPPPHYGYSSHKLGPDAVHWCHHPCFWHRCGSRIHHPFRLRKTVPTTAKRLCSTPCSRDPRVCCNMVAAFLNNGLRISACVTARVIPPSACQTLGRILKPHEGLGGESAVDSG